MAKLGEFELLVMLAVLHHQDQPYANRIREYLTAHAGRKVTRGALYRTLDRLKSKGMVLWELTPSETPARGGHPMRRLSVTEPGLRAVTEARAILMNFFEGLDPLFEEK